MNKKRLILNAWILLLGGMLAFASPEWASAEPEGPGCKDPLQLLDSLEKRRAELDKRTQLLDLREQDLNRLHEKLGQRIGELEKLRSVIQNGLNQEKDVNTANIELLADIYPKMKVRAAAEALRSMDQDTAVKVLKAIRNKKAVAKILSKMNPEAAVKLADELGLPMAEKRNRR